MKTTGGRWSELQPELLTSIGKRLATRIDVLQFRSTCSSWRSSLPLKQKPPPPPPLPYPVINIPFPHPPAHYTLTQATVYRLQPLHNPSNSPPKSWLIKVSESNLPQLQGNRMRLLNPLSTDIITPLPGNFPRMLDLSKFRISEVCRSWSLDIEYEVDLPNDFDPVFIGQHNSIQKPVLLSLSDSNDIMVVVIQGGGQLSAMRLGEERWTQFVECQGKVYSDLINFKGKIYALRIPGGDILVIDSSLNITEYSVPLDSPVGHQRYLLESCGELWLLSRGWRERSDNGRYYSGKKMFAWNKLEMQFLVYKLNEEEHKWVDVPDLGDRILFAGRDCSFSVSAADFEGNCKGNCIFFLNDSSNIKDESYHDDYDALRGSGGKEPEIYLLGDRRVHQLVAYPGYADLFWPLPSWLALGLQRRSAVDNACSSSSQP